MPEVTEGARELLAKHSGALCGTCLHSAGNRWVEDRSGRGYFCGLRSPGELAYEIRECEDYKDRASKHFCCECAYYLPLPIHHPLATTRYYYCIAGAPDDARNFVTGAWIREKLGNCTKENKYGLCKQWKKEKKDE